MLKATTQAVRIPSDRKLRALNARWIVLQSVPSISVPSVLIDSEEEGLQSDCESRDGGKRVILERQSEMHKG